MSSIPVIGAVARTATVVVHCFAYVFIWAIPAVIHFVFVELPLRTLERCVGRDGLITRRGRQIYYVAEKPRPGTHYKPPPILTMFGLVPHPDPTMEVRYGGNMCLHEQYPHPVYGGDIGTLLGAMTKITRTAAEMHYERELLFSQSDKQLLALDWVFAKGSVHVASLKDPTRWNSASQRQEKQSVNMESPGTRIGNDRCRGVIFIFPGLGSTSLSGYVQTFARHASSQGYHCCILNLRGKGGVPLTTPRLVHAGFTDDVRSVLNQRANASYLASRFCRTDGSTSATRLLSFAVGFSLGGSQLIRYLGEERERTPLHAACAVCSPWDFHESCNKTKSILGALLYDPRLAYGLMSYLHTYKDLLMNSPEVCGEIKELLKDPRGIYAIRTVGAYDRCVLCPQYGFTGLEDYLSHTCLFPMLHRVEVPLMCITACDDVFTGNPPSRPRWEQVCNANPYVCLVSSPYGGHLAFLQDPVSQWRERPNWMEKRVVDSFNAIGQHGYTKQRRAVPEHLSERHIKTELTTTSTNKKK